MIKKQITLPNGRSSEFHIVRHFTFTDDGGCIADIGSFESIDDACRLDKQIWLGRVRCDGVTQDADTLSQIYGVLAQDATYGGYEALSPDSVVGLVKPRHALPEKPMPPTRWHVWDKQAWAWVATPEALEEAKSFVKNQINTARNIAERSGFVAYGKLFDSDDKAIQRILGAAQAAVIAKQLGKPLSIEWTCADNTTLIMDADMLIEIPVILAQTADALHQKARTLKAQIDAATTLNEIAAIVW